MDTPRTPGVQHAGPSPRIGLYHDPGSDSIDLVIVLSYLIPAGWDCPTRHRQDRRCDCRGFERWGHCKHVDALLCLIGNGWLDLHLSNPDADVSNTEPPADQPEPAGFGLTAAEEAARVEILAELGGRPDL